MTTPKIKVIYNTTEFDEAEKWFLEGDLSVIAIDTETMGRNWLRVTRLLYEETVPSVRAELEKELKLYKKEAFAPETNHLATIQMATEDERVLFIVLRDEHVFEQATALLFRLLDPTISPEWALQNAKFDFKQFKYHMELDFTGQKLHDTMLSETLIVADRGPDRVSLRDISERYKDDLPAGYAKGDAAASVSDWWTKPLTLEQIHYGAMDVLTLLYLRRAHLKVLAQKKLNRVAAIEHRVVPTLVAMERNGVLYDQPKLEQFLWHAGAKLKDYDAQFREVFGDINPKSPAQVLSGIERVYGFTPMKRSWDTAQKRFVDKPASDKDTLLVAGLRKEPGIQALIALKELDKNVQMARTWLDSPYEGFRPEFIQVKRFGEDNEKDGGTRTGRLSSSPNIQNIPNFMKQFLVAPDGYVIGSADYSAIELRLIASYAGEQVLKDAFNEGRDPHTEMAAWAFQMPVENIGKKSKERRIAKEVNFGFIYGMSGRTFCLRVLRATDGEIVLSTDEGNAFRHKFFERYPAIERWHRRQFAQACFTEQITTRSGRIRQYNRSARPEGIKPSARIYHPDLKIWKDCASATDYKWRNISFNTPIQGSGGDGIKRAMILLHEKRSELIRTFATVHDSIDSLIPEDQIEEALRLKRDMMIEGMKVYLPDVEVAVEVTAGKSWGNAPGGWDGASDIRTVTSDHGLWFQTDYQKEIYL